MEKKSRKIDIFPKGLTNGFGPKMAVFPMFFFLGNVGQENVFNPWFWSKSSHFSNFFFRQYSSENVFYDILERKNFFLSYKDKKFITSKNWYFSNGVNPWFWSKSSHSSIFFFKEVYAEKTPL